MWVGSLSAAQFPMEMPMFAALFAQRTALMVKTG
jgi:hypothetical protein